ncbi:Cytochrome c oxidase assembly protein cox11, mitochondrial [Xylographa soralifera]|nr:Cytochrome c oxidase assembly protein cox11, mitochondrial [Xylographa soralifera]
MEQLRAPFLKKNNSTAYYTLSIILGTVALSYGSVPLYKMICQQMGWGGQPIQSTTHSSSPARLVPLTSSPRLRITFNASVSDVLPWKFTPQQREVRVLPGETALAFYTATNTSTEDIIGVATYSVSPGQVAPYFSKIQCFCFEEQRLGAGETVDMPVFFFVDPDFARDPQMKGIETVTLSYTFFSIYRVWQRLGNWLIWATEARYDKNGNLTPMPAAMG